MTYEVECPACGGLIEGDSVAETIESARLHTVDAHAYRVSDDHVRSRLREAHATDWVEALRQLFADPARVETGESTRALHARDSYHDGPLPDAVVSPDTTTEVAQVLAFAHGRRLAVTPFGAGSSLGGHLLALRRGISLDMTRMNRILDVRGGDRIAVVQPGVTRLQLNRRVGPEGLQFPVDPGADASLGGMASTNAGGTTAMRYGAMRQQVLGLEVVLADGEVVRTGGPVVKSAAGYNLTSLFVGAEGTLGVITELTVRLFPIPDHTAAARATFPNVEAAARAATAFIGIAPTTTRCELIDEHTVDSFNKHFQTVFDRQPTLFLELGGPSPAVEADLVTVAEVVESEGGQITLETSAEGRQRLWRIRHGVGEANRANWPGRRIRSTDVAVPISRLPEAIALSRVQLDSIACPSMIMGHIGDGNYHVVVLVDPSRPGELEQLEEVERGQVEIALSLGGTCTGEHGIGTDKIAYLELEHPTAIPVMRRIKAVLDPRGVMNPGKVLAPEPSPIADPESSA